LTTSQLEVKKQKTTLSNMAQSITTLQTSLNRTNLLNKIFKWSILVLGGYITVDIIIDNI